MIILDYPGGLNISQGLGDKKKERVRLFNVRRTQPATDSEEGERDQLQLKKCGAHPEAGSPVKFVPCITEQICFMYYRRGLPKWHSGKESTCQCWRCEFNPWLRKILWSRKWQPTPVLLPGKFHGQRSLAGYKLNLMCKFHSRNFSSVSERIPFS